MRTTLLLLALALSATSNSPTPEETLQGIWDGDSHNYQYVHFTIRRNKIRFGRCAEEPFSIIEDDPKTYGQLAVTMVIANRSSEDKCTTPDLAPIIVFYLNPIEGPPVDGPRPVEVEEYDSLADENSGKLRGAGTFSQTKTSR
jgi:hypothetical protein